MLGSGLGEAPSEKLCPRKSVLFLPLLQFRGGLCVVRQFLASDLEPYFFYRSCRNLIARQTAHAKGKAGVDLADTSEIWLSSALLTIILIDARQKGGALTVGFCQYSFVIVLLYYSTLLSGYS